MAFPIVGAAVGGALGLANSLFGGRKTAPIGDPLMYLRMFQNPFEREVIGGIQSDFDRQRTALGLRVADLAAKAQAFGGSRAAVLESQGLRDLGLTESDALARLRYAGYNDALSRSIAERDYRRGVEQERLDSRTNPILGLLGGAATGASLFGSLGFGGGAGKAVGKFAPLPGFKNPAQFTNPFLNFPQGF